MTWAEIVVNSPASRGSRTFTYEVPTGLRLGVGSLVRVPFGARQLSGVVCALGDREPEMPTKPVSEVLDDEPVLTPPLLLLAQWIADYYRSPFPDAVHMMLPPGLQPREAPRFSLAEPGRSEGAATSDYESAVLGALASQPRSTRAALLRRLRPGLSARQLDQSLSALIRRGIVSREEGRVSPRLAVRAERIVSLMADRTALEEALSVAPATLPKVRAAIERLIGMIAAQGALWGAPGAGGEIDSWTESEFRAEVGDAATQRGLVGLGLVAVDATARRRDPLAGLALPTAPEVALTDSQSRAWHELRRALDTPAPGAFLLHGVTGSGKTEVYIRLAAEVVARRLQIVVLVPEIALAPQTIRRFAGRFPGRVAVLHSRLTPGERYDEWRRARAGEVDVVVGSRSALFAPLPRLGAIVVDEEHESSYKQDIAPRYHARDAAIRLGELAGVPVVLGSATPDVETYHRARSGRYRMLQLRERVAVLAPAGSRPAQLRIDAPLPAVEVVDLREELKSGNRGIFSRPLQSAVEAALADREQVILFLNRRGAATFVMCRDCGLVVTCRGCDSPFTYHADSDELVCHLCSRHQPTPDRCPKCRSTRIRFFGIGTQRVEDEARLAFPDARILRLDHDVAQDRRAYEDTFSRFVAREADILVGTQMIAKGLDLPHVTVVGVVSADTSLHLPDLRSAERTFQLLTQVAGRAGRGARPGRAIIQTYTPEHYCIQAASRHDYAAFFERELRFRREHGYPPFGQLARLVFAQSGETGVELKVGGFARQLRETIARLGLSGVDLIGPAPAFHERVRGQTRWQLLVRGQPSSVQALLAATELPFGWTLDVDPISIL